MSDDGPLLELGALTIAVGDEPHQLFDDLTCHLDVGQCVALEGPSGVGKTTLLRAMVGLDARARARLRWRGRQVRGNNVPDFRRQAIYVAQTPARFSMLAGESLRLGFGFRHQSMNFNQEHVESLCAALGLSARLLERRLSDLSGGEAQRIALIRALLLRPQVLILDEPASSLDPESRNSLADVLRAWLDESERALLISSHESAWFSTLATERWKLRIGGQLETGIEP